MTRSSALLAAMLLASAPVAAQTVPPKLFCGNTISATASGRPDIGSWTYWAVLKGPGLSVRDSRSVTITFTPPAGTAVGRTNTVTVSGAGSEHVNMGSQPWDPIRSRNMIPQDKVIDYVSVTC